MHVLLLESVGNQLDVGTSNVRFLYGMNCNTFESIIFNDAPFHVCYLLDSVFRLYFGDDHSVHVDLFNMALNIEIWLAS